MDRCNSDHNSVLVNGALKQSGNHGNLVNDAVTESVILDKTESTAKKLANQSNNVDHLLQLDENMEQNLTPQESKHSHIPDHGGVAVNETAISGVENCNNGSSAIQTSCSDKLVPNELSQDHNSVGNNHAQQLSTEPPSRNMPYSSESSSSQVKSEAKLLNIPQDVRKPDETSSMHVVGNKVIPKNEPCTDMTSTLSLSNTEVVDRTVISHDRKINVLTDSDKSVASLSRDADVQSISSQGPKSSPSSAKSEGNTQYSPQVIDLESTSPQIPTSLKVEPNSLDSNLTASQRPTPKLRGNALVFVPDLSDELMLAYRILTGIFGDKCKSFVWPFLDQVDTKSLWDYEERIKHPMWLRKIESKFHNKEYVSITEFATDMRQILENCYRYNGMKHQISKYAQTLECVFEQKLALLSRPLQEKTTLYVTSQGKYSDGCPNTIELSSGRLRRSCTRLAVRAIEKASATPLAFHIGRELELKEREDKRQKIVDRRDEIIKERNDLLEWDKQLIGEPNWTNMKSLWEIPAIGHFLCLCQSVLELDEISFFELERAFALPMESMILRRIFTTLLSTPYQRTRLGKKPPMPYKVWEARLREWVRGWYHVLEKLEDPTRVYEKIGVPERFFEVLGSSFPLDRVQYHELTYYERVWILKGLCDQLFETQMVVRRCLLSQPADEQRPIILGIDGESNSYIHFPQFCGADLRIYRQKKYPDLLKKTKKEKEAEMEARAKDDLTTPKKQRKTPKSKKIATKPKPNTMETPRLRPSRLRQRLTPTVHFGAYPESVISSTGSEDVTSEFTEMEDETDDTDSQGDQPTTSRTAGETMDTEEETEKAPSTIVSENEDNGYDSNNDEEDMDCKDKALDGQDEENQSQTSKTEEIQPICNGEVAVTSPPTSELDIPKSVTTSSTDQAIIGDTEKNNPAMDNGAVDQKTESNTINNPSTNPEGESEVVSMEGEPMNVSTNNCNQSVDAPSDIKPAADPQVTPMDTSETPVKNPLDTLEGINAEEEVPIPPPSPIKPHIEVLPILGEFELVCDSMDSLRELITKFGPPSTPEETSPALTVTGRKRKAVSYKRQPPRKRCEKELHEKLTNLLLELTPWESKLAKFAIRNREKLKKEFEAAQLIPVTDQDIKDIWASEESSSESESSDSESDEEEDDPNEEDEEWDGDGMKLRKRPRKKHVGESQQGDDDEETLPGSVNEETAKKGRKHRSSKKSSRNQDGNKRTPPHKNQINTSLMELIKNLSTDGLKEATRRLQTMVKRGETGRNQKFSKSTPSSSHFSADGKSLRKFLNKPFWSFAKPPSVEGTVAQTVEELVRLHPIYVLNVIFRNLKTSLAKIVKAKESVNHEFHMVSASKETDSGEKSDELEKPSEQEVVDANKDQSSPPNNNKYSLVTRPQQEVVKLSAKPKTKEVMDEIVLEGLRGVLALTKQILREHLATGLSELLPDYTNLQESVSKPPASSENKESVSSSVTPANRKTDKELLLKMLPKPSQYLTGTNVTSVMPGLKLSTAQHSTINTGSTITQSMVVPVPTSKLPVIPMNSLINDQTKGIVKDMKVLQGSATSKAIQTALSQASAVSSSKAAVPQGVYTIKVDASVWSQLQGKPDLQQQFVLQQIKEMQQKQQAVAGGSATPAIKGSLNTPAQTVTCIRSLPKAQVTAPKTSPQAPIRNTLPQNLSRMVQGKAATQSTAVRPSQHPGKPIQHPKPKTPTKARSSTKEPVNNLSQKELIALLQQQQRQLELHRQQQQQKLLLKKKEEQQRLLQQQQQQQHFVIGSSGVLVSTVQPQLLQAAGIPATTPAPTAVHTSPHASNMVIVTATNTWTAGLPTVSQPVSLSTNTTVTASVNRPKMSVNLTESNCTTSSAVKVAALPVVSQTSMATLPGGTHTLSQTPGNRLHLVQTAKGAQILVQTGSNQTPKLVGLQSGINVPNSGSAVPMILTNQNTQLIQQVASHPLQVAPTSTVVTTQQTVQGVQLLLSPTQPNPQTVLHLAQPKQTLQVRANSTQPVERTVVPILGGNAVLNHNLQGTRGQISTLFPQATASTIQRQASPVVIQKPQLQIVKGDGNPKVVIGSPTKLVRLVHPSQLSTATKFIATPEQNQTGSLPFGGSESVKLASKGLQILTQAPGSQQLLCLPVQQGNMVATTNPGTSSSLMGPSNNIQQQQQLQQVILEQLTSGKITMSPAQANAQPASITHLNPTNITLSQQAPQLVTNLQQQAPQIVTNLQQSTVKPTSLQHLNPTNITLSQRAPQIVTNLQQSTVKPTSITHLNPTNITLSQQAPQMVTHLSQQAPQIVTNLQHSTVKPTSVKHLNPTNITLSQQAPQLVTNLQQQAPHITNQSTPFTLLQQSIPVQLVKKPLAALPANNSLSNHQLPVQLAKSGGDGRTISTGMKSSFQQSAMMTSVTHAGDGSYLQSSQTLMAVPSANTPQLISPVALPHQESPSQQMGVKRVSQMPTESGVVKTPRLTAPIQTPTTS